MLYNEDHMGSPLILLGIILILAGIFANTMPHIKIPLLPGDILVQKQGFTFYFPIVSSIILSIILTFIFRLMR